MLSAILIRFLLGLTAAATSVLAGHHCAAPLGARYLRYFVGLGCGFMLATPWFEMVPEKSELREEARLSLSCSLNLIIHFFEHHVLLTVHIGEKRMAGSKLHSLALKEIRCCCLIIPQFLL